MPDPIIRIEGLDEALKLFDRKKVEKAAVQALNKTIKSTLTEASNTLRKDEGGWKIKKKDLDPRLTIKKARRGDTVAVLSPRRKSAATGRLTGKDSFSLPFFGAKDVRRTRHGVITTSRSKHGGLVAARKRSGGKGGVTVQVQKGGEKAHWPNAFITQMSSGHIGAYRRVPGTRMRAKNKEQIREIKVISVESMFVDIHGRLIRHAKTVLPEEFLQALELQYSKGR